MGTLIRSLTAGMALATAFVLNLSTATAANPVVSNVQASQRPGTKFVDITYDVSADTPFVTIRLWISADGGTTWAVRSENCTGDISEHITPGTGKSIIWDAGIDFVGFNSSSMKVKIVAVDTVTLRYTGGPYCPISGASLQTVKYGGSGTPVTAVPASGYRFLKWMPDLKSENLRTDTNVSYSRSFSTMSEEIRQEP